MTIGIAAIAPVSDGEAESWRVEPSLRLAKNIIESVYLHASAAAELNVGDKDATRLAEWTVGGGIGWRPRELLTFTAEYLREAERDNAFTALLREVEHVVASSISYEITDDFLIGGGVSQVIAGGDETRLILQARVEW
ncbi:MAG: hypothetical protein AAGJ51_11170 [Pseudomonadota bacterium]